VHCGADLATLHEARNNNLRLIDYFPCAEPSGPRCGEHRDYGTYTIVFQDGAVGGLEFDIDGKWVQVPASVDAVVS
jgi:isopenicillin N synthase-like dioxygenase